MNCVCVCVVSSKPLVFIMTTASWLSSVPKRTLYVYENWDTHSDTHTHTFWAKWFACQHDILLLLALTSCHLDFCVFCFVLYCIVYKLMLYICTDWKCGVCYWCQWMWFYGRLLYFTDIKVLRLEIDKSPHVQHVCVAGVSMLQPLGISWCFANATKD